MARVLSLALILLLAVLIGISLVSWRQVVARAGLVLEPQDQVALLESLGRRELADLPRELHDSGAAEINDFPYRYLLSLSGAWQPMPARRVDLVGTGRGPMLIEVVGGELRVDESLLKPEGAITGVKDASLPAHHSATFAVIPAGQDQLEELVALLGVERDTELVRWVGAGEAVRQKVGHAACPRAQPVYCANRLFFAACDRGTSTLIGLKATGSSPLVQPLDGVRELHHLGCFGASGTSLLVAGTSTDGEPVTLIRQDSGSESRPIPGGFQVDDSAELGDSLIVVGRIRPGGRSVASLVRFVAGNWAPAQQLSGYSGTWEATLSRDGLYLLAQSESGADRLLWIRDPANPNPPSIVPLPAGHIPIRLLRYGDVVFSLSMDRRLGTVVVSRHENGQVRVVSRWPAAVKSLVSMQTLQIRRKLAWHKVYLVALLVLSLLLVGALFWMIRFSNRGVAPADSGKTTLETILNDCRRELRFHVWRAIGLLAGAILIAAFGLATFVYFVGVSVEAGASPDQRVEYVLLVRSTTLLIVSQLIAFYFLRLFGTAIAEYRWYYQIYLSHARLSVAVESLSGSDGEKLSEEDRRRVFDALARGSDMPGLMEEATTSPMDPMAVSKILLEALNK